MFIRVAADWAKAFRRLCLIRIKQLITDEVALNRNNFCCIIAVHRAQTPLTTTSSEASLNNNPIFCLHRKKNSKVGQHTEWTVECCKNNDCNTQICTDICDTSIGVYAISYFTHSNKKSKLLSVTDLDGEKRTQYFKNPYDEPHEVTSQSLNVEKDNQKRSKLNEILKEISDDK